MTYYKALTHDLRPPIQGGEPVFDGTLPSVLPSVWLDTSEVECGAGWNFTDSIGLALQLGGFWPSGRSSRVFEVVPSDDFIERGQKHRASILTIVKEVEEKEVGVGITELSRRWFPGGHITDMVIEQKVWRWLLGAGYDGALSAQIRQGAWGAWDAWGAWGAWDARGVWDAWGARGVWDAWDAWGAWDARDAWGAWDVRGALIVYYVCIVKGWELLPQSYGWLNGGPMNEARGIVTRE